MKKIILAAVCILMGAALSSGCVDSYEPDFCHKFCQLAGHHYYDDSCIENCYSNDCCDQHNCFNTYPDLEYNHGYQKLCGKDLCAADSTRCNGNDVEVCVQNGEGWKTKTSCNFTCSDGQCTGECTAGAAICSDAYHVQKCNNNVWEETTCSGACEEGACTEDCALLGEDCSSKHCCGVTNQQSCIGFQPAGWIEHTTRCGGCLAQGDFCTQSSDCCGGHCCLVNGVSFCIDSFQCG